MLFNSYIFVLLFLPLVLVGYFGLNHFGKYTLANLFLIGMSLWFYGYYNPSYLLVIGCSILFNYGISRLIIRTEGITQKCLLAVGIAANAASIFYFKYYDFFADNVNRVFGTSFVIRNVVLPLGISFFTFQQISYLVDTYRGETKDYGFIEYALFVAYFPQLIAGPIVLHKEMIPQFREEKRRKIDYHNMSHGLYIFAIGLFKKVLIADTLSQAVSWGFGTVDDLSWVEALIVSVSYTLQLYFDFSGYCDMAMGIACMMNIGLPQNFNSPYRSTSIVDFWSRWHMSLTRFLREYIYFPLGGSRAGNVKTYRNIMVVFLVSGIWHGANWTFIVWGLIHGIFNCLNRLTKNLWEKVPKAIRWLVNFAIVNVLWVIFRADDLKQAGQFLRRMISFGNFEIREALAECFKLREFSIFLPGQICGITTSYYLMWVMLIIVLVLSVKARNSSEIVFQETKGRAAATVILLVWSILSFSGVSEFLYFGF
jgi:D-alanyl-lipoteichoic acid acyltransferase DltB (MBOAT superfamily)